MPGVTMPSAPKSNSLSSIGTIGGTVVGGIFGEAPGAAIGAGAGGALGNVLENGGPQSGGGVPQSTGAIDRRIDTIQSDPSVQLAQADAALKTMPPDIQQQYGPTIAAARQRDLMGGVG